MARLVGATATQGVMRVLPFWADGGHGPGDPSLAPRGHVLAAYPSAVTQRRVRDLGPGGLVPFLREQLPPPSDEPLPLVVVLLAYDAGRAIGHLERIHTPPPADPAHPHDALPDVLVARYRGYLEADSEMGPWRRIGDTGAIDEALTRHASSEPSGLGTLGTLVDLQPPERYVDNFKEIQKGITSGDFYQVNLARRLDAIWDFDSSIKNAEASSVARSAWHLQDALRRQQPVSFGALVPCAQRAWLVSGSPECLLRWDGLEHVARSYPIKGTVARGASRAEDDRLQAMLSGSDKERAEHVMIVDLVRNDLGRVATVGGVSVPTMFARLNLATITHLVSEVRAEIDPRCDLADIIGAVFPGGSITGAPKIAAMQAIDRLEGFRRGYYCGSLGVVRGGRDATFSILIRSAVLSEHGLTYATGGGLVADSDPVAELRETRLKALAIEAALDQKVRRFS